MTLNELAAAKLRELVKTPGFDTTYGLEMTLRGSYFDLTQYLTDMEKLPARLLWGPVELQVEKYPEVRMTLQVHTLSTQRSLGL